MKPPTSDNPKKPEPGMLAATAKPDLAALSFAGKLARLGELYTLDNKDDIDRYLNDNQDLLDSLIEIHPKVKAYPEVTDVGLELCVFYEDSWEKIFLTVHIRDEDFHQATDIEDKVHFAVLEPCSGFLADRLAIAAS